MKSHASYAHSATLRLCLTAMALCLCSMPILANDFKPNDLGNTDQVRNNAAFKNLPAQERAYYVDGDPKYNHDGTGGNDTNKNGKVDGGENPFDRGDIAAYCSRYRRGMPPLANVPNPPATEAAFIKLMESVKTCVDDYVEPNKDPQRDSVIFYSDDKIIDLVNKGWLGIGVPMTAQHFKDYGDEKATGFVCIEHALFFASVARELGFPARELNVPLSKGQNATTRYFYQEASTEVFFDGKWYYFDAYETKPPNAAKVELTPDGWPGINSTITDRVVHYRSQPFNGDWYGGGNFDGANGDPKRGWKKEDGNSKFNYLKLAAAATFEQLVPGVRIFVTAVTGQATRLQSGWTPDLVGDPVIPDSLNDLFLNSALTGAKLDIPSSAYLPQGVPIPSAAKPSDDDGFDITVSNDTVTLTYPATGEYCVGVWNPTESAADFRVLISTEGGVSIGLPGELTGQPLAAGEVRELTCGNITQLGS
jgi:hypothetical protein